MSLALDTRQRAMLQEMGVHVWLPGTDAAAVAVGAGAAWGTASAGNAPAQTPAQAAAQPPAQASAQAPVARTATSQPPQSAHTPAAARTQGPASASAAGAPMAEPAFVPAAPGHAAVVLQAVGAANWSELQQAAAQCQACGLCAGRSRSTLSPGTGRADWMVVGDPPDEAEDAAGRAFAHDAGVLLDNMLAALGLRRSPQSSAAYVTNVVKCRPPHGTLVQAEHLAQCAAYLQREIALVQPKVILAMGRFANQLLLGETPALATLPLGKLRGQVLQYRGIAVVPTYHPKTLLHNPADKAKAWADLCLAADVVAGLRAA